MHLDGELIPPGDGSIRVVAKPHPFKTAIVERRFQAGVTLAEIVAAISAPRRLRLNHNVFIGDEKVPRELWRRVRPKPHTMITIIAVPTGGGGSTDILRIVALLAIVAASVFLPGLIFSAPFLATAIGAAVGALTSALVVTAGTFLLNMLIPPSRPKLPSLSGDRRDSPTLFITGARNDLRPFGVIPRPLGKHRMVPPLGALTFTELVGDDQYLRGLAVWGYGKLAVTDLKIGETVVTAFTDAQFNTIQNYPAGGALTLYTDDVFEEALSVQLTQAQGWTLRTSQPAADELSVDVTFPQGLVQFNSAGAKVARTVSISVEYRLLPGGGFVSAGTIAVTEKRAAALRRGLRWAVGTPGQYEVRLQRMTADTADDKIFDQVFWTALRTIKRTSPIAFSGVTVTEFRIKATDQLNGAVDTLNGIVSSILPDWNGAAWVEAETANPASVYRHVLQGAANKRALPDSRVDLAGLQAWHAKCTAAGREFNMIIDFQSTVAEVLDMVAGAGRARKSPNDGKWGVTTDEPQAAGVQHFTPRNSWGFRGSKAFLDLPHGFRVRFVNRNADWRQEERIVYRDGFGESNATKFEGLDFPGITDPGQVWKDGRFHIAQALLRPERFTLSCDVENLVARFGSRVAVTHDVIAVGIASGRIKSLTTDGGGNVTTITSDELLVMELGKSYGLAIRTVNHGQVLATIVTAPGEQATVSCSPAIPAASAPAAGDLFAFGQLGLVTLDCLVTGVRPGRELSAELTMVPYSPAVYTADQGTIPAFQSQITLPQGSVTPAIGTIRSDSTVLFREVDGSLSARIVISFLRTAAVPALATAIEVAYRPSGSEAAWSYLSTKSADAPEVAIAGVDDGEIYELRLRYVLQDASRGPWSAVYEHTVIGKADPPADVVDVLLENGAMIWTYPAAPPDLAGFRVRHNPGVNRDWENAQPLNPPAVGGPAGGLFTELRCDLGALASGQRTIMVKAVDTSGNESVNAGVLLLGLGDIIVDNLVFAYDDKAAGFPGTKVNCSVVLGDLKADDTGGLFWTGQPTSLFWDADPTALFWDTSYLAMTYTLPFTPETHYLPSATLIEATVAAQNWMLEYRPSWSQGAFWGSDPNALFWTNDAALFWSQDAAPAFQPWPGSLEMTRQPYDLKLSATSNLQSIVSGFTVKLDVDDVEESFNDLVVPVTGVRLPLTKSYRQIVSIGLTLQDDGGDATSLKIMDREIGGPLIAAFNAAVQTSGLADVRIKGI